MELRQFAEQILFATTLEEKLRPPGELTDARPGPALAAPAAPGRPAELRFKPAGAGKADVPSARQLDDERERGRLLHFFANHELLATELMALVLLRFPDAPATFRRGVLRTIQDEQEHTRLYLRRMSDCGIGFGEFPVSGFFWRCVAPMENPIDYVAGLSLTFEQANLDFARHFAAGFAQAGDTATAKLLDRIHRDEIAHVAYGLKWFRRWKNPRLTDWDAFCRQLKFPLTPQRAKGFTVNLNARRAAGFDPAFIAELNVFSQSKGRTPGVFYFNPFAEAYIARGSSFTPAKHQAALARDLAALPQFLCRQDDIVLVPRRPAVEFLHTLQQAGFPLPEFVEMDRSAPDLSGLDSLQHRKLGPLRPWAWAPDSMALLAPIFLHVTGESRTPAQRFNDRIAQLYSKEWSANLLREFLSRRSSDEPFLCPADTAGLPVRSLAETIAAIVAIRACGHHKIVVKEALGLAGSNAIRLWEPALLDTQRRWLEAAFDRHATLVVEPWLEREFDFSLQLEMTPRGLDLLGYTGLLNDPKGQFLANTAAPDHRRRLPAPVAVLLRAPANIAARLHALYADLLDLLAAELRRADYLGPLGIDAFVYRTAQGECRLKPLVEINPRYTMGRLTVELMKRTAPGSHGLFRLVNRAQFRDAGCADFHAYARALNKQFPVRLAGEPVPKIREGALCLTDPAQAEACLAIFQVSRAALTPRS